MADVVQFDYEQLTGISKRFVDQSDQVRAQYDKVLQQMDVLKNGAWIGPNADKFYEIMESNLLPATKKLFSALDKAGETTNQVAKMMKDAEEQSKSLFPT